MSVCQEILNAFRRPFVDDLCGWSCGHTPRSGTRKTLCQMAMCSASLLIEMKLRREIFFAGHLSLAVAFLTGLQDRTAD